MAPPKPVALAPEGNYVFSTPLGEGTFGTVVKATHKIAKEHVAVKVLEKKRMLQADEIEVRARRAPPAKLRARPPRPPLTSSAAPPAQRVGREIQILKLLKHPNVVRLWEILYTQKRIFLVMEFAARGELFQHIVRAGRLAEDEGRRFFGQIIAGVAYLHSQHVVHRDLKPENLLLDANRNILIADFGLSTRCAPGQVLKHSCGSPCYAAPEMLTRVGQQMGYVGHPVDLWSCGVTLYAMLCGCLPFEHANTSSLYKKIIAGNYSEPRHLSRDARDILRRILNTDARKRFTVPQIQSHAWSLANGGGAAGGRAAAGASATLLDETASLASWVPDSSLLERLERHGYAAATTAEELAEGRHTAATASYFLLRLKEIRDAPKAPAGTARTGALTDRGGAQPKPPAAPRAVLSARDGNTNAPRAGGGGGAGRRRRRTRGGARHARRPRRVAAPRSLAGGAGPRVADAPNVVASVPQGAAGGRGARRARLRRHGAKPSGGAYTPRGGDERSAAARLREAQRQHLLANAQQHAVDRPRPPSARAPYRPTSARGAAHGPGHAAPRAAPPAAPRHGADFRRGRYVQPVSARAHNTRLYAR